MWRPARLMPWFEIAGPLAALLVVVVSYRIVSASGRPEIPISPTLVALLLGANLLSFMGLMVLVARRVALHRAARSGLGGKARLHVRLVAFFSLIATAPTLLVVIFASLLFQLGTEFWFSDKATVVSSGPNGLVLRMTDGSTGSIKPDGRGGFTLNHPQGNLHLSNRR